MKSARDIDVKFVKGIGPSRARLLEEELKIRTCHDLIHHFPTHYVDRSQIYPINRFAGEMPAIQVRGRFVTFNTLGEGAKTRLVGLFSDGTATMEVVWFQRIKAIKELYVTGKEYIIFGKPQQFNGHWSMVHPEVDPPESVAASAGMRGVYPLTEKLRNRGIAVRTLFVWGQNADSAAREITERHQQARIGR